MEQHGLDDGFEALGYSLIKVAKSISQEILGLGSVSRWVSRELSFFISARPDDLDSWEMERRDEVSCS